MTLRLIRSHSNAALWSACAESFLQDLGASTGPTGHPAWLWVTHRDQRDALLEMAAECGLRGWLRPPYSFLSELRKRFGITARPIGLLAGRLLVARLAAGHSRRLGLGAAGRERGPARAHMLDAVFSDLLPEGVPPAELERALAGLESDDFGRRRNAWVADTYREFLAELEARDRFDPRSIHAMVAARIEAGGLRDAIGGAHRLHVYGITSLRGRRRLFRALAEQSEVEVCVYLPAEEEPSEWDELGECVVVGADAPPPTVRVQPAPDAIREVRWVAREIKRLLADGETRPHEIAVVAHSGREDTRRMHRALERAGVPSSARIRTVLSEIPALKAALQPLSAQARGWDYPSLRRVLGSPYFRIGIDLRVMDYIATTRRVQGLDAWAAELERMRALLESDSGWRPRASGVSEKQVEEAVEAFAKFRETISAYAGERSEGGWIELTLKLLEGEWFDFRARLCQPVGKEGSERWDLVRLDQRGVRAVEDLLREWRSLVGSERAFAADEWYARLHRLLDANELALSTPLREGVQVLEAHEAALTPFRHTFVFHANDGVFPRAAPRIGVFADAERDRLRDLGLPLVGRGEAMRRERTLWRAVTNGAQVTITYRSTDANGIPRLASPMVPDHDPDTELPRVLDPRASPSDPAAAERGSGAVSAAEYRVHEVLRLVRLRSGGEMGPVESPDPDALRHAVLAAFAEELRGGGLDPFVHSVPDLAKIGLPAGGAGSAEGDASLEIRRPLSERPHPWNGLLRDPTVLAYLSEKFGTERRWSASQLQQYGLRPFDFLVERVLRLDQAAEADEDTSPLAFGSVAHRLLERFYSEVLPELPASFDERTGEIYARVTEEVFREAESDEDQWLGVPALWAVTREKVRKAVAAYLAWELDYLATREEVPILIEHAFGFGDEGGLMVTGEDVAGAPARLRLCGRIDRVDRHGSGASAFLRVIDYKSSQVPAAKGYGDGALLQSALYMRALERLAEEAAWGDRVGSGVFRAIKKPGKPNNGAELRASGVAPVLRFALSIPARIRAGRFEAVQAASTRVESWQTGRAVTRSAAVLSSGTRFETMMAGEIAPSPKAPPAPEESAPPDARSAPSPGGRDA